MKKLINYVYLNGFHWVIFFVILAIVVIPMNLFFIYYDFSELATGMTSFFIGMVIMIISQYIDSKLPKNRNKKL